MRALVKADRLDAAALLRSLEGRGSSAAAASSSPAAATSVVPFAARSSFYGQQQQAASEASTPGFGFFGGGGGGGGSSFSSSPAAAAALASSSLASSASPLGSATNPIVTMAAEPSARAQLWRTLRTLGLAFVLVSGVGAALDATGGLAGGAGGRGAGVLHNPDLRPQAGSPTRFEDVKGVDEAKHELSEVVEFLKDPSKFTALGGKLPKGVLLVG